MQSSFARPYPVPQARYEDMDTNLNRSTLPVGRVSERDAGTWLCKLGDVRRERMTSAKQHSPFYCRLMNWLDFRFWNCECHYHPPYGKVIMAGCPKHD